MRSPDEQAVSTCVIQLMKGVLYQETHETAWAALARHGATVRDHFTVLGVDVVVDDIEGYAYLRGHEDAEDEQQPLPRLIARRSLSYNLSLLLVLLRKRMVEFEATSAETRLILSRGQIVDMISLFLPSSTNEARIIDQVDTTIKRAQDLGFLRPLRDQRNEWEVRRILKAYVDAQTLADFDAKLSDYRDLLTPPEEES